MGFWQKPPLGSLPNFGDFLMRGCVGLWPMNECSGNKVFDLSGNGNTGTHISSPPWVPGKFGSAVDYDGSADYTTIPDSPSLGLTTKGTLLVWFYSHTRSGAESFLSKGNTTSAVDISYALGWDFADDTLLRVILGNDTSSQIVTTNASVSLLAWHQFGVTWDNTTVQLYLDGVPDNSAAQTITPYIVAEPLIIAALTDTPQYQFDGLISQVMIWNLALSASEIALLYREPF